MSDQESQTREIVQKRIEQFISTLPQDEKGKAARDGFSLIMKYSSLGTPDSLKRAHDTLFKLLVDYPEYERFRSDIENVLLSPNNAGTGSDTGNAKTNSSTEKKGQEKKPAYYGKQQKELTKDELFNESIKKLEKELLYNVRLKKTIAPDLFTKAVKRTVVEDYMTSGDQKERQEEYRRTEKKVFDEWCIKHAGKTEAQIKEDHDFRFAVDEAFLKEKSDLLEKAKAVEALKNNPSQNPKKDVVSIALTETLRKIEQAKKIQGAIERRRFLKSKGKSISRSRSVGATKSREQVTSFFIQCFSIRLSSYISSADSFSPSRQDIHFTPTTFAPTATTTDNEDREAPSNFRLPSIKQPKNYIDRANGFFNKGRSMLKLGPRLGNQLLGNAGRGLLGQAGGSIFGSLLGGGGAASGAAGATGAGTAAAGAGGAAALGSNPVGWVILGVIIVIILLVLILLMFSAGDYQSRMGTGGNLVVNISKTADKENVPNPIAGSANSDVTFMINVSYSGNPSQIIIADPIPDNAEFVSADNNPILKDEKGNITSDSKLVRQVEWSISPQQSDSATCGKKSQPPTGPEPNFSCTGLSSEIKSSDGYYDVTSFGCSPDGSDPPSADNCIPGCGESTIPECQGLESKDRGACEIKLKWFAADASRFKCNTKLKVTNPITGQAVIVRVIDIGPACWAEQNRGRSIIDLSYSAAKAINATSFVTVDEVPENTPLGPINACSDQSVSSSASSTTLGDWLNKKLSEDPNRSGLKGMGPAFVKSSSQHNVPIELALGQFMLETQWYSDNGATVRGNSNNPGNILCTGELRYGAIANNITDRLGNHYCTFPSLEAGIEAYFLNLDRELYRSAVNEFISTSNPEPVIRIYYSPSNDPSGGNVGDYVKTVNTIVNKLRTAAQQDGISLGTTGVAGGLSSGSMVFKLTLRPKPNAKDTYIINQAFATAVGGQIMSSNGSCAPIDKTKSDNRSCEGTPYVAYPMPNSSIYTLNENGNSPSDEQWGREDLINLIYSVLNGWNSVHPDEKIGIGDLDAPRSSHASHKCGVDVDLYSTGSVFAELPGQEKNPKYKPEYAIELGKMLKDTGAVSYIFYDDPVVQQAVNDYKKGEYPNFIAMQIASVNDPDTYGDHLDHFHVRIVPGVYQCKSTNTTTTIGPHL